jgi:hypothetical protein
VCDEISVYGYAVLVTSLPDEILRVAQHYRHRADCENPFDELKNHWGWRWGGFTTRGLKRCRFMARMTALVYNWWRLFVRLTDPNQHTETITSPRAKSAKGNRPASPTATPTPRWRGWKRPAARSRGSSRCCAKLRSS